MSKRKEINRARFELRAIALAIAIAGLSGTAHAQYSNIYFFGDSLTDSGAFTSLVAASGAAAANKFTNNPGTVCSLSPRQRPVQKTAGGFSLRGSMSIARISA